MNINASRQSRIVRLAAVQRQPCQLLHHIPSSGMVSQVLERTHWTLENTGKSTKLYNNNV